MYILSFDWVLDVKNGCEGWELEFRWHFESYDNWGKIYGGQ
jgi:hypothetical protein